MRKGGLAAKELKDHKKRKFRQEGGLRTGIEPPRHDGAGEDTERKMRIFLAKDAKGTAG